MEPQIDRRRAEIGLRVFELTLKVLTGLLAAVSVIAVPLLMLFMTGRGPITVPTELAPPYRISFLDEQDRSIVASDARIGEYRNFDIGEESRYLKQPPDVTFDLRVSRTDTDTRAVISAAVVTALLLAWVAVWNLRRVVQTARDCDPFIPSNVTRLQVLAVTAFAVPVVNIVTTTLLNRTLDSDPAVNVTSSGWGPWAMIVTGLAVLALAEVFRSGSELRRFEQETV
jgi:hypothetical protein